MKKTGLIPVDEDQFSRGGSFLAAPSFGAKTHSYFSIMQNCIDENSTTTKEDCAR
jgi:hypothetical protein